MAASASEHERRSSPLLSPPQFIPSFLSSFLRSTFALGETPSTLLKRWPSVHFSQVTFGDAPRLTPSFPSLNCSPPCFGLAYRNRLSLSNCTLCSSRRPPLTRPSSRTSVSFSSLVELHELGLTLRFDSGSLRANHTGHHPAQHHLLQEPRVHPRPLRDHRYLAQHRREFFSCLRVRLGPCALCAHWPLKNWSRVEQGLLF